MSWEKVRLENLSTIVRGSSPRPQGDSRYYGGNIPRLMIEDLTRDGKHVTPLVDSLTEEGAKLSRPMKKGDLVITVSGRTGVPALLAVDACIHDGFVGFRNLSKKINTDYLFHYLASLTEVTNQQAVGAIFKNLTTDQLKSLQIPLPPLETQKRIAEILDTADALRKKDQALLKKYDDLAQAIFIDMFGDPVKNEKGWEVKKLGEVFKTPVKCGPFGSALKREEFVDSGIPVWNMDNIKNYHFKKDSSLYITDDKYQNLKSYSVKNGDIIISRAGTVGKMCVVETSFPKSIISTNLIKISLDSNSINTYYFISLMKHFGKKIGRLRTGSDNGFTHMNTGVLEGLTIPIPPIKLQNIFHETLKNIYLQSQNLNTIPESLFNSLLQKAFKGELVA